ncbi:uncharacterized protein LOC119558301 [Drosophila subpulchrella]|uniref:uncharacterized protein LOC119558301 n=1 Tax=Drosophila subpulchrella TaxID=1486046 RepID=UPI0018A14741|nr:uncharacterized protein LOC119558301 [Drosophila subpulchrella]
MAPRKRISKIVSRSVVPVVQTMESPSRRSVGTQTNVLAMGPSIPPSQHLATHLLPAVNPQAVPLAASIMICKQPAACPPFVPDLNEKACQAVDDGTLDHPGTGIIPNNGERQMNYLKSLMTSRGRKANHWDRKRLETLMVLINNNPPPRWHLASQMWLEVDQLEERIEAYNQRMLLNAKKRKMDKEQDNGQYGGQDGRQGEQQNEEVLQPPAKT